MTQRSVNTGAEQAHQGEAGTTRTEQAHRDGAGTPGGASAPGRSKRTRAERARRSEAGMPGRSGHAGAEQARRSGAAPPQHLLSSLLVRCPVFASSRPHCRVLPCSPHPPDLTHVTPPPLPPPTGRPRFPRSRLPHALPLPLSPAARAPGMPPSPSPPGHAPPLLFSRHARCAHAREFSRALFARLKK